MKILALFCRREGMSREEFRDYYENNHVHLIRSLTTVHFGYRRSYFLHDHDLSTCTTPFECDVVTEIEFESREAFEKFRGEVFSPDSYKRVVEDELRFMDRSRQWIMVVDERVTNVLERSDAH